MDKAALLQVIHNNVAYWSNGDITYIPSDIKIKANLLKNTWKFKRGIKTYLCGINCTFEEYSQHLEWLMK